MPRFLLAAATLLIAACATAAPSSGGVEGDYALAEVNGAPIPARSPTEANVTMQSGTLRLQNGSYWLEMTALPDGVETPAVHLVEGTYTAEGRSLSFTPASDSQGVPVVFSVVESGAMLILMDPAGHRWSFRRR